MKRLMPTGLIDFLRANPNCLKADLFAITLPTGTVLYATEGQWDITIPSGTPGWTGPQTTFKAVDYGTWARGPITSEASVNLAAGTMSLTCIVQQATLYPGTTVGLLWAAMNHLFDGAQVWVYTVYMPLDSYATVSAGVETKFQGTVTRVPSYTRNKVEFECADPFYLLNMKVPSRLVQASCPWSFCDANCGLTAADYTVNFTAKTGSTQGSLLPLVTFTQADGYFTQGVVKCLTGANAGLSQTVKAHAGGLTTVVPWLFKVTVGDTFSVIKGCDKTIGSCRTTKKAAGTVVDNILRFGGTPFVPVPISAV